jgi:hypothetical protein
MRTLAVIALAGVLFAAGARAHADSAKETFFNSNDLTGWEGLTDFWSVRQGAIVGDTYPKGLKFNTFLCSKKKYGDFELQFQVQLKNGGGNSGVQIRSEVFDAKRFAVKGPQADIADGYWGSLYGENFGGMMKAAPEDVVKRAVKRTEFNDYYIKCVGKHVTIKVNGATTVDEDFAKMPATGIIAWQLHAGGPMQVTFRNIRFKDLSK